MWLATAAILVAGCFLVEVKARKVKNLWDNEVETEFELRQGIQEANNDYQYDPCTKLRCSDGQVCKLTEEGHATCVCISFCPEETDPRRKVCSNKNETWNSDCELAQMRCWCKAKDQKCVDLAVAHQHIDYFGHCRLNEDCTDDQMADFPRRMKEWLWNIMRDMAETGSMSAYYRRVEESTQGNLTRRWNAAAVWKFCQLDSSHDRSITIHELFPIRAPLVSLEHCIAPFLSGCDANDDHLISLPEWLTCLQLSYDDMEEECENIRNDNYEEDN